MTNPKYSVIIPVYNRPQEVGELLESLTKQEFRNFEVLIVEDGSVVRCEDVVDRFRDQLSIHYFFKPNTGPGPSRNFGYARAQGDYFVVFDSDCIIPSTYFSAVERELQIEKFDAWGGPDAAHSEFTPIQRAMGYTMSSFLTTGGIRGGKKHVGWFQPRSFNMGISREVFQKTKGFTFTHLAEDIEFSIRMKKAGFNVKLIPGAFVYHKRRSSLSQFYHQVESFGRGRIQVGRVHPEEVKLAHWFPSFFVLGIFVAFLLLLFNMTLGVWLIVGYAIYVILIFLHAWMVNRNLKVALLSVPSALIQLWGYGIGFFKEWIKSYTVKK